VHHHVRALSVATHTTSVRATAQSRQHPVDRTLETRASLARDGLITKDKADSDPQAGLYLAGRWLEDYAAGALCFAQIAKPGKRRKQMAASLVSTSRTSGQLRGVLARLALAASQITACYERYGPDQPWGFADPTSWKCSQRYCHAWASCPGGRGL
jgi:hypothetical protein